MTAFPASGPLPEVFATTDVVLASTYAPLPDGGVPAASPIKPNSVFRESDQREG